jgi:hypothetical protein
MLVKLMVISSRNALHTLDQNTMIRLFHRRRSVELLTLKAARLISECPVCLATRWVEILLAVVANAPKDAIVMDTAPMP